MTGDAIIDSLHFGEADAFLVDARGETIVSGGEANNLFLWHLPLPRNEAERCALVDAAESTSGLRLNDKDVASPIGDAAAPPRIFTERCKRAPGEEASAAIA